ncbi:MAG TPA: acyl-CoA thioesterase [Clostridiaceae bacterium]|nr:acyl-CoA thioesterase [Clostridiaceae bacterium]
MITSDSEIVVRYAETDQMGIVHHSNYPVWFELGRTDFIRKLGYSYSKIEEAGILLPLTDLKCSFKAPARYEDEIIIRTHIEKMTCVRITFGYEIFKKKDMSLIARGETFHAWTDKNLKPVNISKRMPELYGIMEKALKSD